MARSEQVASTLLLQRKLAENRGRRIIEFFNTISSKKTTFAAFVDRSQDFTLGLVEASVKEPVMPSYDPEKATEIHEHVHSHIPTDPALRVKAMESLLVEKGLLTSEAVDVWVETYSEKVGPKVGASIVARAWCDPEFKARLLEDGTAAIKEMDIEGWFLGHLKVVENTDDVHNLVVCTLCSCYPHGVLGLQPSWYKKEAYRSRAVRNPRTVLSEFGVVLPNHVQVKVWDSTAEIRYLVLPQKPDGTDGWDEAALAEVVTRNSMIGTDRDVSVTARED